MTEGTSHGAGARSSRKGRLFAVGLVALACGGSAESDDSEDPSGTAGAGSGGANTAGGAALPAAGATERPSSGVPPDTALPDLSDEDFGRLCGFADDYFGQRARSDLAPGLCRVIALRLSIELDMPTTDEAFRASCERWYTDCLANPVSTDSVVDLCPNIAGTCTATVAEYEQCVGDNTSALGVAWSELPSCSEVSVADIPLRLPEAATPASCRSFDDKCPGG